MQCLKCKTSELPIWMTQVTYLRCLKHGCWIYICKTWRRLMQLLTASPVLLCIQLLCNLLFLCAHVNIYVFEVVKCV